jgi:DNA-binding beta-propeller fold protein YncE
VSFIERARIAIPPASAAGFDHADIHLPTQRLYLAHTGADRIDAVDCRAARHLRALEGHPGVAGSLIDQPSGMLVSTDRAGARISLWQLPDERLLHRVAVDAHPNGLAYDPAAHHVFVFCLGNPPGDDPTVVVVDSAVGRVVERLDLPGRPRWAIHDPVSRRVYANISDPAQIVVLDADDLRLVDAFDVPAAGPHGLALDAGRLFCACDGGVLVTLDRGGRVRGEVALPGAPDVIWHDPLDDRVLVAVGDPGCVCVVDAAAQRLVETIATGPGAHTTAWNLATRSLYAFLPATCEAVVYSEEEPS